MDEDNERWCKGIKGRKHQLRVRLHKADRGKPPTCVMLRPPHKDFLLREFYGDLPFWQCSHVQICDVCDVTVRHYVPQEECPVWRGQQV